MTNDLIQRLENWHVFVGGFVFCLFAYLLDLSSSLIGVFGAMGLREGNDLLRVDFGRWIYAQDFPVLRGIQAVQ